MSSWLLALQEILHHDDVHVVCQTLVLAIYVCVQMGSVCAVEKVCVAVVEMVTYVVVVTDSCVDSCVGAQMNDVVMMTYHDLDHACQVTRRDHEEILTLTYRDVVVTFVSCLEMVTVYHEL